MYLPRVTPPAAPQPGKRGGFTFVELLVAMALMVILTGSVVFIFIRAQQIFIAVDAEVQVYQYARYAFDQMERDLANVVRGRDMEFFNDQPTPLPKGKYTPGEDIPIRGTANRDVDPNGDDIYNYSFTLRQPSVYTNADGDKFRRDSVYFKTVTVVDGQTSAALVEYALTDTDKERPRMVKRLWRVTGVETTGLSSPQYKINDTKHPFPVEQDLCLYAVEAQFELFMKNRRYVDPGDFYSAEQLVDPPTKFSRKVFPPHKNYWSGSDFFVQCFYDQTHGNSGTPDIGELRSGEGGLFKTTSSPPFTFPMMREGDRIFIQQPPGAANPVIAPKDYTIKAFVRYRGPGTPLEPWKDGDPPGELRIQFEEPIDPAGSDRQVQYEAAFVPSGLKATLRIKDAKSLRLRSVSRIFKIVS